MQITTNPEEPLRIALMEEFSSHSGSARSSSAIRQRQRALSQVFGPPQKLLNCIDAEGHPQRLRILAALKNWAANRRLRLQILELREVKVGEKCIRGVLLTDNRGARYWSRIEGVSHIAETLKEISELQGSKLWLVPSGEICDLVSTQQFRNASNSVGECFEVLDQALIPRDFQPTTPLNHGDKESASKSKNNPPPHLLDLESEAIAIFREAYAAGKKTCLLFSMGKDSMVMLRLAQKAFYPSPIPFPLVVIDTQWKFKEMYLFRGFIESQKNLDVIVHINPDAIERNVNPFDFGSATHTQITKTEALKQILDEHKFEMIFGGARREEEKSRAKERIISVRGQGHVWDPREQRPELWDIYNTTLSANQTARVFPLSNWTEMDIWQYILAEEIPMVPLYFARRRPIVVRNGALIPVDDERMPIDDEEKICFEWVRFRTLGCYPLTGAAKSRATTVEEVVDELKSSTTSERISRIIDFDIGASMEQKKREGYF
jgi:sulfate adenylyltransferase subunit 2